MLHQLRKGGVDGAEHAERGCVAVMLGIDGNTVARVKLDAPHYSTGRRGWGAVDVLSAVDAHLTMVRDELARIGSDR